VWQIKNSLFAISMTTASKPERKSKNFLEVDLTTLKSDARLKTRPYVG